MYMYYRSESDFQEQRTGTGKLTQLEASQHMEHPKPMLHLTGLAVFLTPNRLLNLGHT
jgi:hypothetical protein